ncbi:repetitive proline-rich cell wall protein [Colletotrichum orchidophilum]|uniref:Repetitive proline-rich cell wall protein n=1 Tax=Colletotrichum orchidophilum TaxID=1209926 RepID=A0A1G4BML1_9PEZI|nr:repetitive proline-rich cell wall protein [Colletotrichum orchidophilum]OHF02681.1 repetitive proline-rich cell wall protein [Colletotrichum orchidophilum]
MSRLPISSQVAPLAAVSPFGRDYVFHLYTPHDPSYTSVLAYPIELSFSHNLSSRFFPPAVLHLQNRLSSCITDLASSSSNQAVAGLLSTWPETTASRSGDRQFPLVNKQRCHLILRGLSPSAAMKFTSSLLALAVAALATEDHDWGKDKTKTIVTEILTTYTAVCPITITKPGEHTTQYKTLTTTSTVVEKHPTTIYETLPGATKVVTEIDTDYTTYTTYCPITETVVGEGTTRTILYTTLSTVIEKKPTKVIETIPGPTAVVTATDVQLTTLTEVIVETKTAHVEVTQAVTTGSESAVTQKSWVYVTVSGTAYATQTRPASTLVVPTTSAVTLPPATVSSQVPVVVPTAAADARRAPRAALLACLFGAVALL